MPKKIPNLNHQNRYNKLLDVANYSVSPPTEEEFTINKDRILEFDRRVFFEDIIAIQEILDSKENEPSKLEDMGRIKGMKLTNKKQKLYDKQ